MIFRHTAVGRKSFVSSVNVKFVLQYVSDRLTGTPVCHINIYTVHTNTTTLSYTQACQDMF